MQMHKPQDRRMIPCGSKNLPGFLSSFIESFAKATASLSRCSWPEPLRIFRVLQPEAIGGFSRYSPSKVLCTVEGLELILSERNAYAFYDQAGSGASQACSDQKCCDAVKSGGNIIC